MVETKASRRKYHFIYMTTHLDTGRYYIGMHSTDDIDDGYLGSGRWVRRAVKKYGPEMFKREILGEMLQDRESLRLREKEIVNEERLKDPLCMNFIIGGQAFRELHTEKSKRRMSESHKGKPQPWNVGRVVSEETRKKMSAASKGRKLSDDTRRKMSLAGLGRKHSPEARLKMSIKRRARISETSPSQETRAKISAAGKGHAVSTKTREKISVKKREWWKTRRGTKLTKETKKKISESVKATVSSRGHWIATAETRAKMSRAAYNRPPVSDETRKKLSASIKLAWKAKAELKSLREKKKEAPAPVATAVS